MNPGKHVEAPFITDFQPLIVLEAIKNDFTLEQLNIL